MREKSFPSLEFLCEIQDSPINQDELQQAKQPPIEGDAERKVALVNSNCNKQKKWTSGKVRETRC